MNDLGRNEVFVVGLCFEGDQYRKKADALLQECAESKRLRSGVKKEKLWKCHFISIGSEEEIDEFHENVILKKPEAEYHVIPSAKNYFEVVKMAEEVVLS